MTEETSAARTAICLFSGGLDSRLAAKLLQNQGVRITALHFKSEFVPEETGENVTDIANAARDLGMALRTIDITGDMLALVKNPPHGYGSGLNPCIDCRIMQLRKAHLTMKDESADFIVTGEVAGQRPMTQRKDMMRHIDREADVEGLVLRPLSALILEPTLPETSGWVDRKRLYGFSGRKRTPQMELAAKLGICQYPPPAGGCRLTEPGYARRLGDLMKHGQMHPDNIPLLLTGRHFRLDSGARLIVGRNESENITLQHLAGKTDLILECTKHPGPTSLLRGDYTVQSLNLAARITAGYGKGRSEEYAEVRIKTGSKNWDCIRVRPAQPEEVKDMLV